MTKKLSIVALMIMDIFILISGIVFLVYSIKEKVVFKVFNTEIPGIIFAFVVIFLGVRYMKAIFRIKGIISKDNVRFSWNYFKRKNKNIC